MRIVFFGTPPFAVPTLRTLIENPAFDVALVVTQPDRPAGRGQAVEASAVAVAARQAGLSLYQPDSLRTDDARQPLVDAAADLFVVAAYGLIFGPRTLGLPRFGCVNVHASLLPRYRGASPVAAAVLMGDAATGVTLMRMERGLDTGPMLATVAEQVRPTDTTAALADRLAVAGARLAADVLPRFAVGDIDLSPQPTAGASLTRPLAKADGWLDWALPAVALERHVRAMWTWPRAWTTTEAGPLQVHHAAVVSGFDDLAPGSVANDSDRLLVGTGAGALVLNMVQPAGRRPMTGAAYAAGSGRGALRFGVESVPIARPPIVTLL